MKIQVTSSPWVLYKVFLTPMTLTFATNRPSPRGVTPKLLSPSLAI